MPLQNRVTPFSQIVAMPERGLFMGNRGVLHDDDGRVRGAGWRGRRWIICELAFKGRRRALMQPGRFTELFFLDEPTALAAGHRPCAECRRDAFSKFAACFDGGDAPRGTAGAAEIDGVLHAARLSQDSRQTRSSARFGDLPDGAMIDRGEEAWLVANGQILRWTPGGYDRARSVSLSEIVTVLTPAPVLRVLKAGYRPVVHPSAVR